MTDELSFKAYLQRRRITPTAAGDFTKDAIADGNMPDVDSWPQLQAYLIRRRAERAAVAAAKVVWQGYHVAKKKQRNSH